MPRVIKKKSRQKNVAEVEVTDRLVEIKDKIKERQKSTMGYGLAAVGVFLASAAFYFYSNSLDDKARKLEYEAYKVYYNENQKLPLSKEEQYQKSLELLRQAYANKKSARVLLYIANAQAALNKQDEALVTLNDLVKMFPAQKDILPLAHLKIAEIQLKKGSKTDALKALDTLYRIEGPIFKDYALIESARILESDGKKDEAAAKYRELLEKFKDSPFAGIAKAKLATEKKEG